MATFNTYQQPYAERPIARKWFIRALLASLALHAALFFTFRATKMEHIEPAENRLVPVHLNSLGRVEIDEKIFNEDKKQPDPTTAKTDNPVPNIDIPQEKPTADVNPQDTVFKPNAPDVVKNIVIDKPGTTDTDTKALDKMQQSVSKEVDNALNAMNEQLIKDGTKNSKPLLKYSDTQGAGASTKGGEAGIPGMKSLEDALSNTGGGLQNGDKIGIRGGALFSFDKADLDLSNKETVARLQTLATIIQRYPKSTLIIEGYTDSIGDAQYNLNLSQQRADAVRNFLTQVVGIAPTRVQAVGKGSSEFIDPPTYDIAKQDKESNNRRVVIKFRMPQ